jgi:hypothetical protein
MVMVKKTKIKIKGKEEKNIEQLIPLILKFLRKINIRYWIILITFFSVLSFFILFFWYNFVFYKFIGSIDEFRWWFELVIYFYFVPTILPIIIIIVAFWDMFYKTPSIFHWKEIRESLRFFDDLNVKKDIRSIGNISKNMSKSILLIEKWLDTHWINKYFIIIFLIFIYNFTYFPATPWFTYKATEWGDWIYMSITIFGELTLRWISILFVTLITYLMFTFIYKKQLNEFHLGFQKLKNKYEQLSSDSNLKSLNNDG